jgi:hypothetical protein
MRKHKVSLETKQHNASYKTLILSDLVPYISPSVPTCQQRSTDTHIIPDPQSSCQGPSNVIPFPRFCWRHHRLKATDSFCPKCRNQRLLALLNAHSVSTRAALLPQTPRGAAETDAGGAA